MGVLAEAEIAQVFDAKLADPAPAARRGRGYAPANLGVISDGEFIMGRIKDLLIVWTGATTTRRHRGNDP